MSACAPAAHAILGFYHDFDRGNAVVSAGSSGDGSERVKSIPIRDRGGGKGEAVMAMPIVGTFEPGDRIEAGAELQVSTTCLEQMRKCVGRRYRYSPRVKTRLILGEKGAAKGTPLSRWRGTRCSQALPNRNHHCVIVLRDEGLRVRKPAKFECGFMEGGCAINLAVKAHHPRARRGNRLVIGSDGPRGVRGDRGRVFAAIHSVSPHGRPAPKPEIDATRKERRKRLPMGRRGTGGAKQVVASVRLRGTGHDDQYLVEASMRLGIGHLPYNALVRSQLVLAENPRSVNGQGVTQQFVSRSDKHLNDLNGFNCTHGQSAHPEPCRVRKLAMFATERSVSHRRVYLNLVAANAAVFGGDHDRGDAAKVRGAKITARRYPGYSSWLDG